jgi:ADP-ribose pyrophosphatase YjhB (NUDIX family)
MWRSYPGAGMLAVRDGRVLMVLHVRSGKSRWELPSGFVDPGETYEETAVRETLEETGVTVTAGPLLCTAVMDVPCEEYRGINAYFLAACVGNETPMAGLGEAIVQAAFVDLTAIRSRDIHPVDRYILTRWRRVTNSTPFYFRMNL